MIDYDILYVILYIHSLYINIYIYIERERDISFFLFTVHPLRAPADAAETLGRSVRALHMVPSAGCEK